MTMMCSDSKGKYRPLHGHRLCSALCLDKLVVVVLRTIGLILLYYSFSIGITFYQKWLIKGFHYPLTVVTCHLFVKLILASLLRAMYKCVTGITRVTLSWPVYVKKLATPGVASALDIGFSNWSFEFITISLYTMTKSTCIIFILGFAILFDLEKKRFSLIAVVSLISVGLFMFTYQSTQFKWQGFVLVLSASFLGGLRWTLAQLVMQRKDVGLSNPLDMIYLIQPWMILALLPLALWLEIIPILYNEAFVKAFETDRELFWQTSIYVLLGSLLAFLMEFSEYLLLTYTSSLTLSIAGIFKEIFTLFLAYEYYGDQMSLINFMGLVVCLIGISLHVVLKALDATVDEEPNFKDSAKCSFERKKLLEHEEDAILFELK